MFNPFSIFHREPSLLEASSKEQQDAIDRLISQGTFHSGYYLLLLLATLIVTPGLLLDNVAVIIGGMILAPLMVPLLSISLSLVSGNIRGFGRSIRILIYSIVMTVGTSALLTMVLAQASIVVQWIPERINTGVYIFIAFCSGIAGAFAWVKENLSSGIAGVAMAVALLPPLCATGIGLALSEYDLVRNSSILFTANLLGICMAGFLVFWILGFLNAAEIEADALEKTEDK